MTKAHAFVDDLDRPELAAGDRHHLERVLRLHAGDEVTVSDGAGGVRLCRFGPVLEPLGGVTRDERPSPPIVVGFALVKGAKPEWVVQKLTELGVDRIVPFVAARSVVRWDDARTGRAEERLRIVAREAAMQCRRTWMPEVAAIARFAEVAAIEGVALCERGGDPPSLERPAVLVGPEGGWDGAELDAVPRRVSLGANVLRAETAALAAATLLGGLRAGVVR